MGAGVSICSCVFEILAHAELLGLFHLSVSDWTSECMRNLSVFFIVYIALKEYSSFVFILYLEPYKYTTEMAEWLLLWIPDQTFVGSNPLTNDIFFSVPGIVCFKSQYS